MNLYSVLRRLCDAKDLDFRIRADGIQINRRSLINPDVVVIPWNIARGLAPQGMIDYWADPKRWRPDAVRVMEADRWDPAGDRRVAQEYAERFGCPVHSRADEDDD